MTATSLASLHERRDEGAARSRTLSSVSTLFAWSSLILGIPGLTLDRADLLSLAACTTGAAFVTRDLAAAKRGHFEPITLFALSLVVTALANFVGLLSIAREGATSPFALYMVEKYLPLASALFLVGGFFTILGYRSRWAWGLCATLVPPIRAEVTNRRIIAGGIAMYLLALAAGAVPALRSLGTISALMLIVPAMVIFTLARAGASGRFPRATPAALVLLCIEVTRAALFAYLRSEILFPIFAFTVGSIAGARSLAVLRKVYFLPIYAGIGVFVALFATLGAVRSTAGIGAQRIAAVAAAQDQGNVDQDKGGLGPRFTSFNQLSQVGRLVAEDGYLDGQTLQYLGFAFVPRFLWPAKPKIAKGQWFAYRIGLAFLKPDGSFTNSINMTVPGELYLNFGWLGVVVGCFFFGVVLAGLWSRTGFWTEPHNVFGGAFGFYLLWVGFGLGADLQILVTLTAAYLVFLAVSQFVSMAGRRPKGVTQAITGRF